MPKTLYMAIVLLCTCLMVQRVWSQGERREQGNLVLEGIPAMPAALVERMVQYQNTRAASLQDWDPAGEGMLIATRFGETTQLHYVAKPGGARRQLTFFAEPVSTATMHPDPSTRGFLYTKDIGSGGEFYQIFYFNLDTGASTLLTDGASRNGAMRWSHKGDKFVYRSTRRNGQDWDLFVSNLQSPQTAQPILAQRGSWSPVDWSPDDTRLLVSKYISAHESSYHVLDLVSGQLTQIQPTPEKIAYGEAVWARDGKGLFLTSDAGSAFKRLQYYDFETARATDVTSAIPWDVSEIDISRQRDMLAFTTNEDGISKLYLLDTATLQFTPVPGLPLGLIYRLKFHPDGRRLGLVLNTPQTPGDIYVLHLADQTLVRWTDSEVGGLNPATFVVPQLRRYETFDRVDGQPRLIPVFYYTPRHRPGPYPVLIMIHGGPEAQYRPFFTPTVQYYVNELGLAVIAPNVRGSSGYGKHYLELDNGYKREDAVKDIGTLLDWIARQPDLDASRVAVSGASYGGYMVLAALTHYSDRLKCGIEGFGISNFVTFLENTEAYRRDLRRPEYGDERDPAIRAFLFHISPLTQAHKITKPLFIAQGLNDPRVPVSESEHMVAAIRQHGGTVWYMLARDEGHGFTKKSHRDNFTHATVLFLEEYLLK